MPTFSRKARSKRLLPKEAARIGVEYPGVISCANHVAKMGRSYFVEVNILVSPGFPLQSVSRQDSPRLRLWMACGRQASDLWFVVCITEDERWL